MGGPTRTQLSPNFLTTEVRETNTSVVLLMGDRAYKVKNSVASSSLTSRRSRRAASRVNGVDPNRRLAPDVYLGGAEVRPAGASSARRRPLEVALAQRRWPQRPLV